MWAANEIQLCRVFTADISSITITSYDYTKPYITD